MSTATFNDTLEEIVQKPQSRLSKLELTEAVMAYKANNNLTWEGIAKAIGVSDVWLTSACLGMNSVKEDIASKMANFFELGEAGKVAFMAYPTKVWDQTVPTDPLIYRLYEIVGVYGPTLKEVIQEKFGDGIMSAIDFSMEVDKIEDPKGDRVLLTMNGKFLPYKSW